MFAISESSVYLILLAEKQGLHSKLHGVKMLHSSMITGPIAVANLKIISTAKRTCVLDDAVNMGSVLLSTVI